MFLVYFILMLSGFVFADQTITDKVYMIDQAPSPNELHHIYLNSGLVLKLKSEDSAILKDLNYLKLSGEEVELEINSERFIKKLSPFKKTPLGSKTPSPTPRQTRMKLLTEPPYVMTTIENISLARKYFHQARYLDKESQCFNRAMVWSYEWWQHHSLKSGKLFIFFTRSYIRRYNFDWWFHVAPYVHVKLEDQVQERVMDVKYSSGPLSIRSWTNIFMRGDTPCRVIQRYSDYADYPYSGECFIQRSSMYTYQPADLQMHEAWGFTKNDFLQKEVRQAYWEAFDEILPQSTPTLTAR